MENKHTQQNESKSFRTLEIMAITLAVSLSAAGFLYWRTAHSPVSGQTFSTQFPQTYTDPLLIKLANIAISIAPLGALPARAATEGNVVKYVDAFQNTDIVQTKSFHKIKEDIILKAPGHPDIFEYQIDLHLYDFAKDKEGNIVFYEKGHKDDMNFWRFDIPAPFLIDADGKKSGTDAVSFELTDNGRLTLVPSAAWLAEAKYPVVLDPTVELNIINVHSHPKQGDNWVVDFATIGTTDLKIIPNDQATINDDVFVSLSCDGQILQPQILPDHVIYYPNWSCSGTSEVIHYTARAGTHTLRFEFGGQVSYAYNSPDPSIIMRATGGAVFGAGGGTVFRIPVPSAPTVEYLIVAGGGGGGSDIGGGGGAGGLIYSTMTVNNGTYSIAVGGGGGAGTNGGNSSALGLTAIGGGAGGNLEGNGSAGGSGGGSGGYFTDSSARSGGAGTSGQGFRGGNRAANVFYAAAGGGGASVIGGDRNTYSSVGTPGGDGTTVFGVTYAGGGGGGGHQSSPAAGGAGGGGAGGYYDRMAGTAGTTNTGGGGGGGGNMSGSGAAGGSGIVIIRYSDFYNAAVSTTGSPTYSVVGGYKIYKWTTVGSGSITF